MMHLRNDEYLIIKQHLENDYTFVTEQLNKYYGYAITNLYHYLYRDELWFHFDVNGRECEYIITKYKETKRLITISNIIS